jgi:hypothetical protein
MKLGAFAKGASKFAGNVLEFREQDKAKQMMLEDRLAQKEMRDLQKRSLEQALNKPAPEVEWDTRETEDGIVQVNPRTGEARPVTLEDRILRPPKKPEPSTSFSFQQDKDGNIVGINPRNPTQVVPTGVQAPEKPVAAVPGAAERQGKRDAAVSALALLNELAADVEKNGTNIDPRSPSRAGLASRYAQFQLKLKDAAKLGQLSESDLNIMLNALPDPTSATARGKALGSEELHRANVLAGVAAVRSTLERDSGGAVPQDDDFSDEELAAAYKAGKRDDASIAAWIKAQRGPRVPR